tara:strand:+ start:230 stop:412 length:183 start_codon:yes stop_codon:yes gene_type:complete
MTQEEIRRKKTDLFGHLEAACNAAHALMQLGFMDNYTYEQMFNGQIAQMENRLREIKGGE